MPLSGAWAFAEPLFERPDLAEGPWAVSAAECLGCGREYVSAHPAGSGLECPGCGGKDVVRVGEVETLRRRG